MKLSESVILRHISCVQTFGVWCMKLGKLVNFASLLVNHKDFFHFVIL